MIAKHFAQCLAHSQQSLYMTLELLPLLSSLDVDASHEEHDGKFPPPLECFSLNILRFLKGSKAVKL